MYSTLLNSTYMYLTFLYSTYLYFIFLYSDFLFSPLVFSLLVFSLLVFSLLVFNFLVFNLYVFSLFVCALSYPFIWPSHFVLYFCNVLIRHLSFLGFSCSTRIWDVIFLLLHTFHLAVIKIPFFNRLNWNVNKHWSTARVLLLNSLEHSWQKITPEVRESSMFHLWPKICGKSKILKY